jgi:hypothetical protein
MTILTQLDSPRAIILRGCQAERLLEADGI